MLRLILGRAGMGKTARIMEEIRSLGPDNGGPGASCILIVPEQYSHEAERELARVCGDRLSLYAEVLSFTRLHHAVSVELGGSGRPVMDGGGQLLCMSLALDAAGGALRVYGGSRRQPELLKNLLDTVQELKTAQIGSADLTRAAGGAGGVLGDKLRDLALILEAFDAVAGRSGAVPADRLDELALRCGDSRRLRGARVYVDGFTDFTAQERAVLRALASIASLTVCLTCDSLEGGSEVFDIARGAARRLLRAAREDGVPAETVYMEEERGGAMGFLEKHLFSYTEESCEDAEGAVVLCRAPSVSAECELAAGRVLRLVQDTNCRWRDVAVAVRGFEEYRPALESVFSRYGIPLYLSAKSDILQKPLPTLLTAAADILSSGWSYESVFTYLKTGLAGLTPEECDELENYVLLWSLRGGAWTRPEPWRQHPEGFGRTFTGETEERLRRINLLRERAAAPLRRWKERSERAQSARGQAEALGRFLEEINLAERLDERAAALEREGREALAAEYAQLWALLVSALEQCAQILGERPMEREEFTRLLRLMLSQYSVGTIPVALDRVSAGDMDRMRRRHIRHLLVLGASDERLPRLAEGRGVFSDAERQMLRELSLELGDDRGEAVAREYALIYNCLTLPSETLYVSFAAGQGTGESRPSFVMDRLQLLFRHRIRTPDLLEARSSAREPALELAVSGRNDAVSLAARRYFFAEEESRRRLQNLERAVAAGRGRLGPVAVRSLYGDTLHLTPTRVDAYASCRFAYFMQYGLKARARAPAAFSPPEYGSFLHYVLAQVAREAGRRGGFAAVDDKTLAALTDEFIELYIREELGDFREKSRRFVYLFRRLARSVRQVVLDMAEELRASDFQPLDFELDFSRAGDLPPVALGEGEESVYLTGVADRVDGWEHEGKLYIRVVDYKTGKKSFSLSDVWYGMGLQMLLYLFSLEKTGESRYGKKIVPAGVLYVPARDALLSKPENLRDEEIVKEKAKERRRSGLLLDDPAVLAAMERGEVPKYLPVTVNREGRAAGEALADAARFARLARHIDDTLLRLSLELRRGSIEADPFFRSQQENACRWCDYLDACHFDPKRDRRRYLRKLQAQEVWARLEGRGGHG